jgi:hypothetical protein
MTHTLHRRGDQKSLSEDYVMLIMPAKGINEDDAQEKLHQIWELLESHKPHLVNFGNATSLKKSVNRLIHAVFKDRERLKACLKEIKERDFGLSVVLSGLYSDVEKLCAEIGLAPHTVEHSLGIHGNTEKLPDEDVLEITTMCGHAMVSTSLVTHLADRIESGEMNFKDASTELSRGCACGIFNPYRAEKLLKKLVSNT